MESASSIGRISRNGEPNDLDDIIFFFGLKTAPSFDKDWPSIDEIGTKEPSILKRGSNRILVELPGVKDPERIKELLGKTAELSFRLVTKDQSEFGNEKLNNGHFARRFFRMAVDNDYVTPSE